MKKIVFVLLIISMLFVSCNSSPDNEEILPVENISLTEEDVKELESNPVTLGPMNADSTITISGLKPDKLYSVAFNVTAYNESNTSPSSRSNTPAIQSSYESLATRSLPEALLIQAPIHSCCFLMILEPSVSDLQKLASQVTSATCLFMKENKKNSLKIKTCLLTT